MFWKSQNKNFGSLHLSKFSRSVRTTLLENVAVPATWSSGIATYIAEPQQSSRDRKLSKSSQTSSSDECYSVNK